MESPSRARGSRRKGILVPVLAIAIITILVSSVSAYASIRVDQGRVLEKISNEIASVVKIERIADVTKIIPFETIVEEDPEMYEDEPEIVKVEGQRGSVQVTEKVIEVNGKVESREILSFQELTPSVDRVVVRGTKERSYFVWPYNGLITSYFGYRYDAPGTYDHQGIDISASYGDVVVAARSGVVTSDTGWDGGYGLCVHIDHGDGVESLYGHNSELAVSPGDYVEAGQVIAYAGSTGWSSGTHVHFEVHDDGTAVDPLALLP